MSAQAMQAGWASAVVVHGSDTFYERNGLARKLADRGVSVRRVYCANRAAEIRSHDYSGVDLVIVVASSLPAAVLNDVRDAAAHYGTRLLRLSHRTSDPSWRELEGKGVEESAVVLNLHPPPVAVAAVPPSKKTLAQEVAESEELTRLAIEENEALRRKGKDAEERIKALGLELEGVRKSSDVQARERLAADLARKETERARAVREGAEAVERLTAQLEGTEAVLRNVQAERDALARKLYDEPAPAPELARVRKILAACADGILTSDEALAKLGAVLA